MSSLMSQLSPSITNLIRLDHTHVLTAFHQWASPIDNRMRSHAAAIRALDIELEGMKDRLDKLDGGFPPPPIADSAST